MVLELFGSDVEIEFAVAAGVRNKVEVVWSTRTGRAVVKAEGTLANDSDVPWSVLVASALGRKIAASVSMFETTGSTMPSGIPSVDIGLTTPSTCACVVVAWADEPSTPPSMVADITPH